MAFRTVGFKALCALALLGLLLTACLEETPKTLHRNLMLSSSSTSTAEDVDIEVGRDGTKFVAWSECDAAHYCTIYLTWTKTGAFQTVLSIPPGGGGPTESSRGPALAVTDSGLVYLVWSQSIPAGDRLCYAVIDPSSPGAVSCQPLNTTTRAPSIDPPVVAAGGNTVYAVYAVTLMGSDLPAGQGLRYRRLNNPSASAEGWINAGGEDDTDTVHYNPAIAVSVTGKLFAAWFERKLDPGADPNRFYRFACAAGTSVVYPGPVMINEGSPQIHLAIEIAPDRNTVLTAFVAEERHTFYTHRYPTACDDHADLGAVLPVGEGWYVDGDPDISFMSSGTNPPQAQVAFAGRNRAVTGDTEIWVAGFDAAPQRITDNDWDDVRPITARTNEPGGYHSYALAWRSKTGTTYEDVYLLPSVVAAQPVQVFDGASRFSSMDIASHGGIWVGGAWIAPPAPGSTRGVVWMTFNDWEAYVPQLHKAALALP